MVQNRIPVSRAEYEDLRNTGFGADGPSRNSEASSQQSNWGDVPRGSTFSELQRRGMLSYPVDDDDDGSSSSSLINGSVLAVAGVAAVVIGVGAGLFYVGRSLYNRYQVHRRDVIQHRVQEERRIQLVQQEIRRHEVEQEERERVQMERQGLGKGDLSFIINRKSG